VGRVELACAPTLEVAVSIIGAEGRKISKREYAQTANKGKVMKTINTFFFSGFIMGIEMLINRRPHFITIHTKEKKM
jgi:hypothetical protein